MLSSPSTPSTLSMPSTPSTPRLCARNFDLLLGFEKGLPNGSPFLFSTVLPELTPPEVLDHFQRHASQAPAVAVHPGNPRHAGFHLVSSILQKDIYEIE